MAVNIKDHCQKSPFIIAEVGQNHQGDAEQAIRYIREFSKLGADAVKFQTRDNRYLFDEAAYERPYDSPTSFAPTYGEHREFLELDKGVVKELIAECAANDVVFMSTPFDEPSLEFLVNEGVQLLKIASFDIGNLPFIKRIARAQLPTVVSVGGGKSSQIRSSIETLRTEHDNITVLHCVSEYPCEASRMGLDNIEKLKEEFPDLTIGLSDHFNGILSGPVGYMKGARVFEKHVTFNRSWKGTDHSFALEMDGFRRFCRDIRRVPEMMPAKPDDEVGEEAVFRKLGKSLIAREQIKKGDMFTLENLSGRIFLDVGLPVRRSNEVIGTISARDIELGEKIRIDDCIAD